MFMFYEYVFGDDDLSALKNPEFELHELKGLEYNEEIGALQIITKNKEYFFAPMDKDSAKAIMTQIGAIGAQANVRLNGVLIYGENEDNSQFINWSDLGVLVRKCREQRYSVSRL